MIYGKPVGIGTCGIAELPYRDIPYKSPRNTIIG